MQEPTSSPVGAGVDDFPAGALDHTEDRLHLPTLPVAALMQVAFHLKRLHFQVDRQPIRTRLL